MSVSLGSEALEMRLEGVREATSRVSALIHWLTLPEHIRKTLEECFPAYSDEELARRIEKDPTIIGKWREQSALLAQVFLMIKDHKEQAYPGTLASNKDLVEAIMRLNQSVSSSILAKAIGHAIRRPRRKFAKI